MEKNYNHKEVEEKVYKQWEENGYFKPEINPNGKPYCIILPPPNANGSLHFGHAMFTVEDILIRFHRMKGFASLWLPGSDHAGIETQFVFEKKLQKEGKSRLDFDRKTLYEMIKKYVDQNRGGIENQLRRLGFSLDWSRERYTLDPEIIKIVYKTFKKMYDDGLIYRGKRLVNYCTRDGTSFSDLEVVYEERSDPLYYIKYGPLVLATTRPETKFGDTAVAVNPNDKRYKQYIGKTIDIQTVLGKAKIKVIADESVDPEFGTGAVKITPAHDFNDFEVGKKHNLEMRQVIDFDGKLNHYAGKFAGLRVLKAREAVVREMQKKGLMEKIDENYVHRIGICYKCKTVLEPLPLEQWFIKTKDLAAKAIDVVKSGKIKIYPKNFENWYFQWLENLTDWNISRQIVWGIRIPAWKCLDCSEIKASSNQRLASNYSSSEAKPSREVTIDDNSRQSSNSNLGWIVTHGDKPNKCPKCNSIKLEQDPDTFDTWFSSGQWPFATLQSLRVNPSQPSDFEKFYPTSVIETGYDILKAWVSRMVMLGLYITGEVPFRNVLFHGIVNDPYGKKMSKSKGNVVDPLEIVDQYGADSVRFALVYGNATGNDQSLSYTKLDGARKFINKLWNIGRFIEMKKPEILNPEIIDYSSSEAQAESRSYISKISSRQARTITDFKELLMIVNNKSDKEIVDKIKELTSELTGYIENYQFNLAAERLYEFTWHEFADKYIEDVKNRLDSDSYLILNTLYLILLKLLHPFIPFVTEELYKNLGYEGRMLIVEKWPA